MKAYPGKLHLCIDGWTSPHVIAFLGATVHWVHEGHMQSLILDFIKCVFLLYPAFQFLPYGPYKYDDRVTKAHMGQYLAACIAETLHDFGIDEKMRS